MLQQMQSSSLLTWKHIKFELDLLDLKGIAVNFYHHSGDISIVSFY